MMLLSPVHAQLAEEARSLRQEKERLETIFDEVTDPILIESTCHRMLAVQNELDYVYQKAKELA